MPYACISDLHRGPKERLAQSAALEAFLDFAKARGWYLLYLGDIVDLWDVGFEEAMDVDGAMIQKLADYPDYLWVPGNHDEDQESMRRILRIASGEVKLYARIGQWLCFHGYQLDPALDSAYERAFTSIIDRVSYDLEGLGPFNAIRAAVQRDHRTNAPLIARSAAWGPIVLGHSHVAETADDGRFINAGTWNGEEEPHYVLFDDHYTPALIGWPGQS